MAADTKVNVPAPLPAVAVAPVALCTACETLHAKAAKRSAELRRKYNAGVDAARQVRASLLLIARTVLCACLNAAAKVSPCWSDAQHLLGSACEVCRRSAESAARAFMVSLKHLKQRAVANRHMARKRALDMGLCKSCGSAPPVPDPPYAVRSYATSAPIAAAHAALVGRAVEFSAALAPGNTDTPRAAAGQQPSAVTN